MAKSGTRQHRLQDDARGLLVLINGVLGGIVAFYATTASVAVTIIASLLVVCIVIVMLTPRGAEAPEPTEPSQE